MSNQGRFFAARGRLFAAGAVGCLVAVAVVVGVTQSSGGHRRSPVDLGPFAGYVGREHRVDSASARWTVAAIGRAAGTGFSSTWVGVQAPGRYAHAPFIQVGTTAQRIVEGAHPPRDDYAAFWSDLEHDFHPQGLFRIQAGDRVFASLRLRAGRWHVVIVDRSARRSRRFTTTAGTRQRFNQAEWVHEDPSQARNGGARRLPYAGDEPVRFDSVEVDGRSAQSLPLVSSWMTPPGGGVDLAPGPMSRGAFTVARRALSAEAARYLAIIDPPDLQNRRLVERSLAWSSTTPRARYVSAAAADLAAERRADSRLAAGHWPSAAAGLVARLLRANRRMLEVEARLPAVTPGQLPAWRREWTRTLAVRGPLGQRVRRALGAPGEVPFIR